MIQFQFSARSMRPHFPDSYEGCVNGCDLTLCEILQVNISRFSSSYSNNQSTNRNSSTSVYSNTQSTNRNPGFQNRGEIILNLKAENYTHF